MTFIEIYNNIVASEHPSWKIPTNEDREFDSLYELDEIFNSIIPIQLGLQELSSTTGSLVGAAILTKSFLSRGSSTSAIANHIASALDAEINSKWAEPWLQLKTVDAPKITPTPPASLLWTAPPPVGLAVAGTGEPYPDGSAIENYFNDIAKTDDKIKTFPLPFKALGKALTQFVKNEYPLHGLTGPPPYISIG